MYRQCFNQPGAFFQCITDTLTPAYDFEKLDRRIQTFGSENAFPANLFCTLAQTLECAADCREFTPAVTFPKAISEGICHLAKFNFQLLKFGMHKCVQLRRKVETAPRKGRSLSRETRECAYKQFELALLLSRKTEQRNSFCSLQRFDGQ